MKKLGIIGGLSWHSTLEYYREINVGVQKRLGSNNSAELLIHSLNFAQVEDLQALGQWKALENMTLKAAQGLVEQGAQGILIAANTMHKVTDGLEHTIGVPFLHIVDAMAKEIQARGMTKIGLLGTSFTMTEDFYKKRMLERHKIQTVIPDPAEIEFIHHTIYTELTSNIIKPESKLKFQAINSNLMSKGAEGVILGCTEIPMLITPRDSEIPLFDSLRIHAREAVDFILS